MRIGIVAPSYPPECCGVGDYSHLLAGQLQALGHEISIWTDQLNPQRVESVAVHYVGGLNKIKRMGILAGELREPLDALIVQYTPRLYSTGRFVEAIPLELFIHRFQQRHKTPIVLMAHECHYPTHFNSLGLLVGYPQKFHFALLCHMVDKVVFSYESAYRQWQGELPHLRSKMFWIPVGANIVCQEIKRFEPFVNQTKLNLIHFGSAHPSHQFYSLFRIMEKANGQLDKNISLYFIGMKDEQVKVVAKEHGFSGNIAGVVGLGVLTAKEVSGWLLGGHLMLAPFVDGVSTRRGSVMAGLAHGLPVATTFGVSTGRTTPWEKFCFLTPSCDADEYIQMVLRLLEGSWEQLTWMGQRGYQFFESHFSWKVIAQQWVEQVLSAPKKPTVKQAL